MVSIWTKNNYDQSARRGKEMGCFSRPCPWKGTLRVESEYVNYGRFNVAVPCAPISPSAQKR